ncbi:MAG: Rad52/Rad22 family DNA repair protein, partial [Pyrinomonadaceae bacterium]
MAEEKIDELESKSESTELRSIREIVKDLTKPVAKRHLRTRKQGGKEISYIAWHDAVKYLDFFAPGWNYEIRSMNSISGKLIIVVRLSIPCLEGVVYREATGQEDETLDSYGDSSSNAESMALRRA